MSDDMNESHAFLDFPTRYELRGWVLVGPSKLSGVPRKANAASPT
ncbi:MAG: hypothetical protein WB788_08070 [Thermoplasmata archaeon]|nr:hypothetical protein [Thermoplasmata archaeon]